jgi:hypothetical protein
MRGVWPAAFASKPAPTEVHRSTIRLMPNSGGVRQHDSRHVRRRAMRQHMIRVKPPTRGHASIHDSRHAPTPRHGKHMIRVLPRSVGAGLLANRVGPSHVWCLARRIRQQAGSYRGASINASPHAQFLGRSSTHDPYQPRPQAMRQYMIRVTPRSVGAGLLANLVAPSHLWCLARRIRQQAGSYRGASINDSGHAQFRWRPSTHDPCQPTDPLPCANT